MSTFKIYKPRKSADGKPAGAASQLSISAKPGEYEDEVSVYWTIAPQIKCAETKEDNDVFDWKENHIKVKLGDPDIGAFLCVLRGIKERVGGKNGKGLYHESAKGVRGITFEYMKAKDPEKYDDQYMLKISTSLDGKYTALSHSLSLEEGANLCVILESAIRRQYSPR